MGGMGHAGNMDALLFESESHEKKSTKVRGGLRKSPCGNSFDNFNSNKLLFSINKRQN